MYIMVVYKILWYSIQYIALYDNFNEQHVNKPCNFEVFLAFSEQPISDITLFGPLWVPSTAVDQRGPRLVAMADPVR